MGPQHPSTHGVFRMVLTVDGEIVRDVMPHIGYMHRGGEKLAETMDYRQGIGWMDRTEYLAQFNAELSYVMAVEAMAELAGARARAVDPHDPVRAQPHLEPLHVHRRLRHRRGCLRYSLHLLLP